MPRTGKCPHCDRVLPHLKSEDIEIIEEPTPKYHGTSLVCPHCEKVLQVVLTLIPEKPKVPTGGTKKYTGF